MVRLPLYCCDSESTTGTGDFSVTPSQKMKVEHLNLSGVSRCEELMTARDGQCPLFSTESDIRGGAVECLRMTPSRHSSGRSTNGRNRPLTAVHWSHSQWPLTDEKAVVRTTLCKRPVDQGHDLYPILNAILKKTHPKDHGEPDNQSSERAVPVSKSSPGMSFGHPGYRKADRVSISCGRPKFGSAQPLGSGPLTTARTRPHANRPTWLFSWVIASK